MCIRDRLRALRQAAGLSQTKLAEQLGILQRTLCFYELDADCIPSTLVVPLAQTLGVSIEQILGTNGSHNKRGPKSQLERQLETVAQLPRHQQKKIMDVVNALVAQNSNRQVS